MKSGSGNAKNPVANVQWVPLEKVGSNDYNPNAVAKTEMQLLYISIKHDGYTQPVVVVWDEEKERYTIVDGFHRYSVMRLNKDVYEENNGLLPVVVLDKTPNELRASTIRHNRARGKHSVNGMSTIVFQMLENGWGEAEICNELGLEAEEIARLKHITGFSKLFENVEYRQAWENQKQTKIKKEYKDETGETPTV